MLGAPLLEVRVRGGYSGDWNDLPAPRLVQDGE